MTKPKFQRGEQVADIGEVIRLLDEGRWFYLRSWDTRPKHPAFLISMQVRTLNLFCKSGLFLAEPTNPGAPP